MGGCDLICFAVAFTSRFSRVQLLLVVLLQFGLKEEALDKTQKTLYSGWLGCSSASLRVLLSRSSLCVARRAKSAKEQSLIKLLKMDHDASEAPGTPAPGSLAAAGDRRVGKKYRLGRKIGSGSFGDVRSLSLLFLLCVQN